MSYKTPLFGLFLILAINAFSQSIEGTLLKVRSIINENGDLDSANILLSQIEEQNLRDTALFQFHYYKSSILYGQKNLSEAKKHMLIAKKVIESDLSVYNADYIDVLSSLGFLEDELGNANTAILYFQEALVKGYSQIGNEDYKQSFGNIMGKLAGLYAKERMFSEVKDLYREAFNKISDYYYICEMISHSFDENNLEEKRKLLYEFYKDPIFQQDTKGKDCILRDLVVTELELSNFDIALQLQKQLIQAVISEYGKDYQLYLGDLDILFKISTSSMIDTDINYSIEIGLELVNLLKKNNKMTVDKYYAHLSKMVMLYITQEEYDSAAKLAEEIKAFVSNNFDNSSAEYATACNQLSVIYLKNNKLKKAKQNIDEIFKYRVPVIDKESPEYGLYLHNKGKLLLDMKDYKNALNTLTESAQIQEKTGGGVADNTKIYMNEAIKQLKN